MRHQSSCPLPPYHHLLASSSPAPYVTKGRSSIAESYGLSDTGTIMTPHIETLTSIQLGCLYREDFAKCIASCGTTSLQPRAMRTRERYLKKRRSTPPLTRALAVGLLAAENDIVPLPSVQRCGSDHTSSNCPYQRLITGQSNSRMYAYTRPVLCSCCGVRLVLKHHHS